MPEVGLEKYFVVPKLRTAEIRCFWCEKKLTKTFAEVVYDRSGINMSAQLTLANRNYFEASLCRGKKKAFCTELSNSELNCTKSRNIP
ncbi:hypothetical protein L873DRAFT_1820333 [Choiromyces venosus 120613-1]|uniref:Uncharacterized protein n=1 Tax=Choiromyces venosus 120613-1 TaxID=1336337 RepID=A0A3N4IXL4_9PEZI|nr:hypothetical protein L873DRAFT_1820333 [Choiromyces venosus 120613-1]